MRCVAGAFSGPADGGEGGGGVDAVGYARAKEVQRGAYVGRGVDTAWEADARGRSTKAPSQSLTWQLPCETRCADHGLRTLAQTCAIRADGSGWWSAIVGF